MSSPLATFDRRGFRSNQSGVDNPPIIWLKSQGLTAVQYSRPMPLVGHLTEFPLPEVLLLIGSRTGRLRLFDALEYHPMELDLSDTRAHGLHIGDNYLTSPAQVVAELGFVVETGAGSFEFAPQPIVSINHSIPINELVLQLAMRADEKQAKYSAVLRPELFYVLEPQQPIADLSPELFAFLSKSRQLLSGGVRSEDLAQYLGEPEELVKLHLYDLHQFGFVKLVETTDVETLREMIGQKDISPLSNNFFLTGPGSDFLFQRASKLAN